MSNPLNQYEYWKKIDEVTYKHRDTNTTIKIYPLVDTAGRFDMTIGAFAMKNQDKTVVQHEGDIEKFEEKLAAWMEDYHYEEMFDE